MDILQYAKLKKIIGGSGSDVKEWDGSYTITDENGVETEGSMESASADG